MDVLVSGRIALFILAAQPHSIYDVAISYLIRSSPRMTSITLSPPSPSLPPFEDALLEAEMRYDTRAAMPSEVDPLLPRTEPAPEIVGYGFSQKQNADAYDDRPYQYQAHINQRSNRERDKEPGPEAGTDTSPLRTILTIFTTVVAFGLILSILISERLGQPPKAPQTVPSKPSNSITDRVERILSEHPLIGSPFSEHKSCGL